MASFVCYIRPRRRPALGGRDTGVTVYSNCLDARAPNGSRKVSKGSKEGLAQHAAPLQGSPQDRLEGQAYPACQAGVQWEPVIWRLRPLSLRLAWLSLPTWYWARRSREMRWLGRDFRLGGGGVCLALLGSCLRFQRTCLGRGSRAGGLWLGDCGGRAAFSVAPGYPVGGGDRWWPHRRRGLRCEFPCGSFD